MSSILSNQGAPSDWGATPDGVCPAAETKTLFKDKHLHSDPVENRNGSESRRWGKQLNLGGRCEGKGRRAAASSVSSRSFASSSVCAKLERSGGAFARLSSRTIALLAVVICGLSGFLAFSFFYDDVYPCKHSKQIRRERRQPCEASASTAGTPALGCNKYLLKTLI